MRFDWSNAAKTLSGFGGEPITLTVQRTGLAFFDALQLYGAIDLYIGVREDIELSNRGDRWKVKGQRRTHTLSGKDKMALAVVWKKKKPDKDAYCRNLSQMLERGVSIQNDPSVNELWLGGLDRSLQAGVRGTAASDYETMQSAQTSKKTCIAEVPLSQAVLANSGRRRVLRLGNISFLPIFEGPIDLSKVVSPLRSSLTVPNVLCAQALALLALRSSLFAEGYEDRLSEVVFETNLGRQRSDNYSGIISVKSTAVGRMRPADFVDRVYRTFRTLVQSAWIRRGGTYEAGELAADALCAAMWLIQPVAASLSALVTSQEKMHCRRMGHFLRTSRDVQEVFNMSYPAWQGITKRCASSREQLPLASIMLA